MQPSAQLFLEAAVLTASTSALFPRDLFKAGVGNDTIKVTGTGVTSASLKAGIGDDLMSITGGITDGSLFGGTGNDSFNFIGGRASGLLTPELVLTLFSWCFGADTVTLTGALTSTTLKAGDGDDSIVHQSNVSAGLISRWTPGRILLTSLLILQASWEPPLRVIQVKTKSVSTAETMLSLTLRLMTTSSLELVQIPCSLPVQSFITSIQAGSGNDSIVMAGVGVTSNQMTGNTIDLGVGTDTIKFTR